VSICVDQDMDIFVAEDAGKVAGYVAVAIDQDPAKGDKHMIASIRISSVLVTQLAGFQ